MTKRVLRIGRKRKPKLSPKERYLAGNLQTKVELIQALIPIVLMAVSEQLEEEVEQLVGERYSRQGGKPGHHRWGSEERSVYLADQKVKTSVFRVRNSTENKGVT